MDLPREHDRVPVERKERVLKSRKCLEIGRDSHTDRSAVRVLAPDDIILVIDPDKSRIIRIERHKGLAVFIDKIDPVLLKAPVNAVLGAAEINERNSVLSLRAEHADEAVLIRDNCAVEDSCDMLHRISSDDRVLCISPDRDVSEVCRSFLPRHVRNSRAV